MLFAIYCLRGYYSFAPHLQRASLQTKILLPHFVLNGTEEPGRIFIEGLLHIMAPTVRNPTWYCDLPSVSPSQKQDFRTGRALGTVVRSCCFGLRGLILLSLGNRTHSFFFGESAMDVTQAWPHCTSCPAGCSVWLGWALTDPGTSQGAMLMLAWRLEAAMYTEPAGNEATQR